MLRFARVLRDQICRFTSRQFLAVAIAATGSVSCRSTTGYCAEDPQPARPTFRLAISDASGVSLDSVARVARIGADGRLSEFVSIGSLARIDPSGLGGRSAMRLVVTAPGFRQTEVTLPEDCQNESPRLIAVVLVAAS